MPGYGGPLLTWEYLVGGSHYYTICNFSPTKNPANTIWGYIYPLNNNRFKFVEVPNIQTVDDFYKLNGPNESLAVFSNNNRTHQITEVDATTIETYLGFLSYNKTTNNVEMNKTTGFPWYFSIDVSGYATSYMPTYLFATQDNNNMIWVSDYDASSSTIGLKVYNVNDPKFDPSWSFVLYFQNYEREACDTRGKNCPPNQKCVPVKFSSNYCSSSTKAFSNSNTGSSLLWLWILLAIFFVFVVYFLWRRK